MHWIEFSFLACAEIDVGHTFEQFSNRSWIESSFVDQCSVLLLKKILSEEKNDSSRDSFQLNYFNLEKKLKKSLDVQKID